MKYLSYLARKEKTMRRDEGNDNLSRLMKFVPDDKDIQLRVDYDNNLKSS